jgi:hypothetical protein
MVTSFVSFLLSLLYAAVIVLLCASQWVIYQKAGKRGWYSLIPVYNILVLLQIVGKPWWWILLFLIPFVNIIFAIWMLNMLSKSFGKNEGFTVGLLLLSFIFLPILAFGKAKYVGPAGAETFDPANPPSIQPIEYRLDCWVITIAMFLIINAVFWFLLPRLGVSMRGINVISTLLFGIVPLISAGLLKNRSWRITLIILGTIYLALQLSQMWTSFSDVYF